MSFEANGRQHYRVSNRWPAIGVWLWNGCKAEGEAQRDLVVRESGCMGRER